MYSKKFLEKEEATIEGISEYDSLYFQESISNREDFILRLEILKLRQVFTHKNYQIILS